MASLNKVFLIGNLTRDPEFNHIPSGTAIAKLRLAISESYLNKQGNKVETVCYVDVDVWARQAEICQQYLHKGSPVMVEGRLQLDQWEKDGEKRSKLRVRADRVQFLGRPRQAEAGDAPAGAGNGGRPPVEEPPFEGGPGGDSEDVIPF